MNKSKLREIKKIMGYQGHPEQKRLLRRFKKSYNKLSREDRMQVIKDLRKAFEAKEEKD